MVYLGVRVLPRVRSDRRRRPSRGGGVARDRRRVGEAVVLGEAVVVLTVEAAVAATVYADRSGGPDGGPRP
ncbi:hypothetical protein [Streptomyces bobili]|uniref:hypothetical protein n=1 Tax=Streptomyces bobili TaxID=67280 RepID=UPI003F4D94F9